MKQFYQKFLQAMLGLALLGAAGASLFSRDQEVSNSVIAANLRGLEIPILSLVILFGLYHFARPFFKPILLKMEPRYAPADSGAVFSRLSSVLLILSLAFSSSLMGQSGKAFLDFNGNGVQNGAEPGVKDIVVKLYGDATLPSKDQFIGEARTDANGNYNFASSFISGRAALPGEKVRVEFSIPATFDCDALGNAVNYTGLSGTAYGTSVQFITGLQSNINFAIIYPGQWAPNPDPLVMLPCYAFGNPELSGSSATNAPAFISYNFLRNGVPFVNSANSGVPATNAGDPGVPMPNMLATIGEVGSLYGVAFSKQSQKVFTSAVLRRHAALGPLGSGGIYLIDPFSAAPDKTTDFLDLDAIGIFTYNHSPSHPFPGTGVYPPNPGDNTSPPCKAPGDYIGTNVERGLPAAVNAPSTDYAAGDQIGKLSLGDIDISDDGRYLYVMNLYDRKIYEIDLVDPSNPQAPTAADVATRVRSWDAPDPGTLANQGEHRPWGLKFYRGKLYVGLVLSGQDADGNVVSPITGSGDATRGSALRGYVYELNLSTSTFIARLDFPFTYDRPRPWIPWGYSNSSPLSRYFSGLGPEREWAEPIIADLEFDDSGNMLIGILDRKGHQYAINNNDYAGVLRNYEYSTAGELLRANVNVVGNSCTYEIVTRNGTTDYYDDNGAHPESVQGPLAVLPGENEVLSVWLDPIRIRSGGTLRYNNETGLKVPNSAYEVFDDRTTQVNNAEATPSKANGLGDVELSGTPPPIEIGNRVWADTDGDGIQDSGEPGINGVEVQLKSADGLSVLGTTTTSGDGNYYFNEANVTDGDVVAPGNQAGPQPLTDYRICIPGTEFNVGNPLSKYVLAPTNQAGTGLADFSDNDAAQQGNNDLLITLTTGVSGASNHTFDIGLIPPDWGDLPDTYTTTDASGGPYHTITPTLKLGACVDGEPNGQPQAMAGQMTGGDDFNSTTAVAGTCVGGDDEDGIVFETPMAPGQTACVRVTVMNSTGNSAVLQGWIDFDGDGSFGTGEQLNTLDFSPAGVVVPPAGLAGVQRCFTVPLTAVFANGAAFARFRLSPAGNLGVGGDGTTGEVEDYKVTLYKVGNIVFNDYNNNGQQNTNEVGINGVGVQLIYFGVDGVAGGTGANADITYSTTTSNMGTDGMYMFTGLVPGAYKLSVPTAPVGGFTPTTLNVNPDVTDADDPTGVMVMLPAVPNLPTGENGLGDTPNDPNYPDNQNDLTYDFGYIQRDYGDLPSPYSTLTANSGPSHVVSPLLKIGACIDAEADGNPQADAGKTTGGDDFTTGFGTTGAASVCGDDEDGIDYNTVPLFIVSQPTTLDIPVMNMTGVTAKLTVFFDFNNDGAFGVGEMFNVNVPNNATTASVIVNVPGNAVVGQDLGFRMRLATDANQAMSPTGPAQTGEVEDYVFQVIGYDYGDLPNTYGTTDPNAPKHIVSPNLKLGASVDVELNGAPEAMAGMMSGGDDADAGLVTFGTSSPAGDDENGVVFTTPMVPGSTSCIVVTAMNMNASAAVLQMWIDFNGDGDVLDAGEAVTTGSFNGTGGGAVVPANVGLTNAQLCFTVPAAAVFAPGGAAFVRFGLSPAGNLTPNTQPDPIPFGEIEDYKVQLGKLGNLVFEDYDFDGQQDPGEPGIDGVPVTLIWLGEDGAIGGVGVNADVTYPVVNSGSGTFDQGEYYFCGLTDGPGALDNRYKLIYATPANMTPTRSNIGVQQSDSDGDITGMDLTMAMETFEFLFPTPIAEQGNGDEGFPGFGNFDDNQTDETHDQGFAYLDYGDLPETGNGDNFNSTMAETGAVHVVVPFLKLGASVDGERDATTNATASGDDATNTGAADDEDGIVFATPLIPGNDATITVTAMNMTGADAFLQGWIDWDNSGTLDPGEVLAFTNGGVVLPGGANNAPYTFPVPAGAVFNDGMVFARFRLSTTGGLNADGPAKFGVLEMPQGEVEDYKLNVGKLGNLVFEDRDFDGVQDANEPGIDGTTVTLVWAGPNGVIGTGNDDVTYAPLTTGSGTFDPGEYYFCGLTPGTYKLIYATPANMTPTRANQVSQVVGDDQDSDGTITLVPMDLTMAMETFTIVDVTTLPTNETGNGDDSPADSGTFPDGQTDETHDQGFAFLDYGDLPETGNGDNFNSTMAEGGAVHVITPGFKLGAGVDGERDATTSATATGDDNTNTGVTDDEDGVTFTSPLIPGNNATISVVSMNPLGATAVLQGWIDWDNNGLLDAGEALAFTSNVVPTGNATTTFTFPVPAAAIFNDGMVFARFRLSPSGVPTADGPDKYGVQAVPQGEVEDYKLNVGKIGNLVFEDRDFDGVQDAPATEPGINGVQVTLVWAGANGVIGTGGDDVTYNSLTTGSGTFDQGEYYYCGLIPGTYKLIYATPNNLTPTRSNQGGDDELDSDGTITMVPMDLTMAMEVFTIPDVTLLPTGENGNGDNGVNPTGTFPDNQTDETHDQGFACLDYGDLPESGNGDNFNTTMAEGGAIHVVIPGLSLGGAPDCERDATPNTSANGDDNTFDDLTNTCSEVAHGTISAASLTCGVGTVVLTPGPDGRYGIEIYGNMSAWPALQTAVNGIGLNNAIGQEIFADVTTIAGVSYLGNQAALVACVAAAEGLPVGAMNGGAVVITSVNSNCLELEAGRDDEDGIKFTTPLIPDNTACIEVTATNTTGSNAVLQGWIDWNNSGTLDANENIVFTNPGGGNVPNGGVTGGRYCFEVPADAIFNDGMVYARFRLSPTGGLAADGPAKYDNNTTVPQGEVEDYKLNVGKVGNYVWEDTNFDGLQGAPAAEPAINGAVVTLVWAGPNGVIGTGNDDVTYKPLSTGAGAFDDGEYYYCGLIPGTYKLVYASPADMTPTKWNQGDQTNGGLLDSDGSVTGMNVSMAMETFTIPDVTNLPTAENGVGDNGTPGVGTFPDPQVDETHDQGFAFLDYGDLPNNGYPGVNYHTTMAEGGPIHVIRPGLKLGSVVDGEQDAAIPDTYAVGDDLDGVDDEDGIVFPGNLVLAPGGNFTINVTAMNMTGAPAVLQGWIDWDSDGVLEASEALVLPNVPVGGLVYAPVNIPIPANANFQMCMMYARFRLSPTGGLTPDGPGKYGPAPVPQGEVEDHKKPIDIKPPTIICPANIVRNTDPNFCSAVVNYQTPFASDDCGPWSLVRTSGLPSGSAFPKGITMVNWKVTDGVGYTAVCGFTVTVNDNQPPSITCPANIDKTSSTDCNATVFYAVKGLTDNCPGVTSSMVSGLPSGSTFPNGTTTIVLKATDAVGLMKTCSFTVKVADNQPPVIVCPANLAKTMGLNACNAPATTYPAPTATDNCSTPSVSILSGLPSGTTFPKGVTTVIWKATDGAGLTKTCSFKVTVNDAQAPAITCPPSIVTNMDTDQCNAVETYANATFTDNCAGGSVIKMSGLSSGSAFPKGINPVVFKATDASGNVSTCLMTVTVTDAQLPTITCPANIVRNNDFNQCCSTTDYATPAVADNCSGVVPALVSGFASHGVFQLGITNVVWKATDASGNTATCAFTVTINDTQPPMVMCPGNTTVNGSGTPCGFPSANLLAANVMMENCPGFTLTSNAPAILPSGITHITWTATDAANNVSTCSYRVTVGCTTTPWGGGGNQSKAVSVSDNGLDLLIAPNPATSEVSFRLEGVGEKGGDLTVFDQLGRMVWQQAVTAEQTQVFLDVNRSAFASGAYQVRLRTEYGMVTKGLVINRL